jgi:hypothetical protein
MADAVTPGHRPDPFASLDAALPLTLLPVRLEARYLPRGRPTHLHVRIFPDVIHADAHHPGLSDREIDAGRHYWTSIWGQTDAAVISEARRWLAAQSTPYRALWVAEATKPANAAAILDPGAPSPDFPDVPADPVTGPVRAALLPDAWTVRLYDGDLQLAHTEMGTDITRDLAMAPRLGPTGIDAVHPKTGAALPPPLAFLAGQDLLWTVDFEQAEAVGMGVRIPIADVPDPVGALLVMGVRAGREVLDEGAALDALLTSHWYTRGLDVVPQGTPTNNSDAGRSGVSLSAPDVDELFERQASERPLAPAGRAVLIAADPAMLYRLPAADSLSLALGRIRANALDKVAHAEWAEGAAAWAMNLAIGYATLAGFLNGPFAKVGGDAAPGEYSATLRDWFVDWVRGGAALPVLRCGEQPYGLLPITHRPVEHPSPLDFESQYEHRVTQFLATWKEALPVAALDPEATDSRASGTELGDATIIAEVLGGVPHPTALQLRLATDHILDDTEDFYFFMERLQDLAERDDQLAPNDSEILAFWENRRRWIFGDREADPPVPPPTVSAQLANLDLFRDEVQIAMDRATYQTTGTAIHGYIDELVRPLLEFYQASNAAVPPSLWDWSEGAGLGDDDVVRLEGTTFAAETTAVEALVTTAGDLADVRDALSLAIALLDGFDVFPVDLPKPLLAHLIDINARNLPPDAVGPVRLALQMLLALVNSPRLADPEAQLERLMRETLGLSMYRIDAWVSAIAAARLASKRRAQPAGAQLGGYGWLLDLAPSDDPPSQGFIHAPSMQHAASAAVLRSGWSASGTATGETPLSVDLSSARARGAQWVLDGVRNGQDLAELLGARLERFLHDALLDEWIDEIREEALTARGIDRPPTAIVDGVLAARGFSRVDRTEQEEAFRQAVLTATAPTGTDPEEDARRARVRAALRKVAADLDAVADLTMAQSVHSLLQDNPEAASAAMAVTGGGDGAVPPIDVTATERGAQLVAHRVVAMWTADESAEPSAPLAALEPRLIRWLERLLPGPDDVVADRTVTDPASGKVVEDTFRLSQLGVGSVEAAMLGAAAPNQARSRLGRAVVAAAAALAEPGHVVDVDLAAPRSALDGAVSIDELGLIGAALLDVLGRARPLTAADLVLPAVDASAAGFDSSELTSRAVTVEKAISSALTDLAGDTAQRVTALMRCASIGVPKSVAAIEAGASDEAIAPVQAELRRRLAAEDDRRPEPGGKPPTRPRRPGEGRRLPSEAEEPADPVETALDRLRRLGGETMPIVPLFVPVVDEDRAAAAASETRRTQVADAGRAWLRQYGRARPDLGSVVELVLLAESAAGSLDPFGLAELPHRDGLWAAVDLPADADDRLSIVALTGPDALGVNKAPVGGLVFDSWVDGIPRDEQQTGVAIHFDAPSARPPQTVLLSVVDDERGFDEDEIADQLLHTIELAKLRAIDPHALGSVGHYLPTVYLPDDAVISGGAS